MIAPLRDNVCAVMWNTYDDDDDDDDDDEEEEEEELLIEFEGLLM